MFQKCMPISIQNEIQLSFACEMFRIQLNYSRQSIDVETVQCKAKARTKNVLNSISIQRTEYFAFHASKQKLVQTIE